MSGALFQQKTLRRWKKVWALCILVFIFLVFYASYPTFTSSNTPIGGAITEQETTLPWWEANDCQCASEACGNPLMTFRSFVKDEVSGTCGSRAWAAGDGQRVLSFSLFGDNPDYWKGLYQILPEVEKLYPGWKVRLYTNPRGRAAALCPLLHRHPSLLFVCDVTNLPPPLGNLSNVDPELWRVAPLGDPQVTTMVVRDSDSQVSQREVAAVQEWLASGKPFHVMRDHPYHNTEVLAGMWGARWDNGPTETESMMKALRQKVFSQAVGKNNKGQDQIILKDVLWPAMAGRMVAHDSYTCQQFKGSSPWPTQRSNRQFVGAVRFRKQKSPSLRRPCPKACRPPAHPDWVYC